VAAPPETDPAGRSPVWVSAAEDGVCVNGLPANGGGGGGPTGRRRGGCRQRGFQLDGLPANGGGGGGPAGRRRGGCRHRGAQLDVKLSLVNVALPTNTEGTIPQLWDVKQRANEVPPLTMQ